MLLLQGCATPSSPTGGPPDEEGPKIIRTEPETGTTNFSGRTITLHFSEFVERSSLQQAIVVEPDIGITYSLDWGRKSVEIKFDEDIPDLTTLIVTIGTEFSDMNGNEMASPKKVAVSTGPEIDKGKLFGKVIDAKTGEGLEKQRILLYRDPYDLKESASYIASTDTGGTFQFDYLREGKYKAFWVDDRNRNKVWDRKQERAQPFAQEFFKLEKSGADTIGTVYVTATDTTNPSLQGVGLFSSQRMRMRFSEDIQLTDSASISITDTLGHGFAPAFPLYVQPDDPYILFAQSEKAMNPDSSYTLSLTGIVDQSENGVTEITQTFTGSSQKDTTKQRIIERNTTSGYFPTDPFEITYAKPIDEPAIRDSLVIVEGNKSVKKWPNVEVRQNILSIAPREQWKDGVDYEVRVWDPQIEDYRKFQPDIWHSSQMGALNITTEDSTAKNIRLRLINEESEIRRDTTFSGKVKITNLPPVQYKVIAWQDQNDNNKWDFGLVDSFVKPEPYFIQANVPVKQGFTGDMTITFPNSEKHQ